MNSAKKSRRSITLETKMEVLRLYGLGNKQTAISTTLKLPTSTVRSILDSKDKIIKCAKSAKSLTLKRIENSATNMTKVKMESMLKIWIEEIINKNEKILPKDVMEKAKVLYRDINEVEGHTSEIFVASRGWFSRFCKRSNLEEYFRQKKTDTDQDKSLENSIPAQFKNITEDQGYSPKQVFNLTQTSLFWKRTNTKVFLSSDKERNKENNEERVAVLLGANAYGDFKLTPMVIHNVKNPTALQGFPLSQLPVVWRTNRNANMTQALFQEWFISHFCPEIEKYFQNNNIENRALIVLDNSPYFPQSTDNLFPNIQVIFYPCETFKFVQPMDQGIVDLFKCNYLKSQLTKLTYKMSSKDPKILWSKYNVMDAIENIREAWDQIDPEVMNSIWNKLWEDCVREYKNMKNFMFVEREKDYIIELAKDYKLDGLTEEHIQEWLKCHEDYLKQESSVNIKLEEVEEDFTECNDEREEVVRELRLEHVAKIIVKAESLISKITDMDPIRERSTRVARDLRRSYECYVQIYREKMREKKRRTKYVEDSESESEDIEDLDESVDKYNTNNKIESQFVSIEDTNLVNDSDEENLMTLAKMKSQC